MDMGLDSADCRRQATGPTSVSVTTSEASTDSDKHAGLSRCAPTELRTLKGQKHKHTPAPNDAHCKKEAKLSMDVSSPALGKVLFSESIQGINEFTVATPSTENEFQFTEWYEDPIFDAEGEKWRLLQFLKCSGRQLVKVSGTTFYVHNVVQVATARSTLAQRVSLVAEANNSYDAAAVSVLVGGLQVGYIPSGVKIAANSQVTLCKCSSLPKPHVWLACFVEESLRAVEDTDVKLHKP